MKKIVCILFAVVLCFCTLSACAKSDLPTAKAETTKQGNTDNYANAMLLYNDLLNGKISVLTSYGTESLNDYFRFGSPEQEKCNQYAYFDMNKDGIPELLLNSCGPLSILTVKNNKLLVVCAGYDLTVLDNGSVLKIRDGAAPTHIDYDYITLDMKGNQTDLYFSKYKDPKKDTGDYKFNKDDWYIFNNKTVSKATWDSLTHKYLSIPYAKIDWKPYTKINK